jgi:photosystem II stability/assembly factor-like uncharacterized protein
VILAHDVGGGIHRSVNAGTNWLAVTNLSPQSDSPGTIALNSSGVALAINYTRPIDINFRARYTTSLFRSINFGSTWTRVLNLSNFVFTGVSLDGNVAYAVGRVFAGPGIAVKGVVYRSGDSGANWLEEDVEVPPLYAVSARLGETFVVGDEGDIHRRPLSPPTRGVLHFDPGAVNFGFVPFGDSAPRAITFNNVGISNITITNVTLQGAAASQFAIGGTFPKIIPPGASDSINVFFNPTNVAAATASLRINANDPEGIFSAPLSGRSSVSGWVLKAPLTTNTALPALDVQMVSSTVGYALTSTDLFKTTDGGATWRTNNSPPGALRTMHWVDANEGFIGGGTFAVPPVIPGDSFIYRTANGGTNWVIEYSSTDQPVGEIHVRSTGFGYATTLENFRLFADTGAILRTANGGLSWIAVNAPETTISPSSLVVVGDNELFVGEGARLYRSADGGTSWTSVVTNGTSVFRGSDFVSVLGWAVGDNGTIWRATSGGDDPSEWSQLASFTTNHLNDVHFISLTTGWAVPSSTAPAAQIFRSDNSGSNWRDELAESPYAGPTNLLSTVVAGINPRYAVALGTAGSVRRLERFTNELEGIAVSQPELNFGQSVQGFARFTNFVLRNLGDRVLNVSNLLVDGLPGFQEGFRPTNTVPFSLAVGASRAIGVIASNLVVGTNEARLSIVSDGALQSLNVSLRSVVTPTPVVVSFATDPPGLGLRIDNTNVAAPANFTVRQGPDDAGSWDIGSFHAIEAPELQIINGVTYAFSGSINARWASARAASTYWGSFQSSNAWSGVLVLSRRVMHDSRDGPSKVLICGGGAVRLMNV